MARTKTRESDNSYILAETCFPLREAPKHIPGRNVCYATCYRWMRKGLEGEYLECTRIGAILVTSEERLRDFFERVNIARRMG